MEKYTILMKFIIVQSIIASNMNPDNVRKIKSTSIASKTHSENSDSLTN